MNKIKALLNPNQTELFDKFVAAFTVTAAFRQNDVYFRNLDMQSSISKHTLRVRHQIEDNNGAGAGSYKITFTCLSESSDEWAKFSEICSACDENIYKILSATGFKRLATLNKYRRLYGGGFKMSRDDIFGLGPVIKAYYNNEAEKKAIVEFMERVGINEFEKRTNLQMVLESLNNKTAANKDEGVKIVKSEVFGFLGRKERVVIAVAGGSGSGKTFIASELVSWLPDVTVFTLDDYYKDRDWITRNLNSNFDDPDAINLDLAREQLMSLKRGETIMRPRRSLEKGYVTGYSEVKPCKMIVVEGIFTLNEKLADLFDYSIFIEANLHGKLLRRLMRDIGKTGQDFEGILLQYVSTVQPMYEKHIEVTKNAANLIINNEFAPYCETYDKINRFEFKIRCPFDLPLETLKNHGAALISEAKQVDKYYVAPGLNFMESDELLRIREESSKLTLTYKGPRKGSFQRPRIDFPINMKFAEVLIYLGYSNVITTEKTRYKFKIETDCELDIAVDDVKNLGVFIEVRVGSENGEKKAGQFLKSLGLEIKPETNKGYFEDILKKTFAI
jgi:predicted adenylyl cyclase CyaB